MTRKRTKVNYEYRITLLEIDFNKSLTEQRVFEGDSLFVELESDLAIMKLETWVEKSNRETIQYVDSDTATIQTKGKRKIASATLNKLIERLTGEGDEHCKSTQLMALRFKLYGNVFINVPVVYHCSRITSKVDRTISYPME